MNTIQTILLKTTSGDYVADYWRAASDAHGHTHRQLVNRVHELWPELWGDPGYLSSRGIKLRDEHRDWRRWVRSLGKLELAIILNQK